MHRFTIHGLGSVVVAPTYLVALEDLRELMLMEHREDMVATNDEGGSLHTFMYGEKDIIRYPSGRQLSVFR